MQDFSGFLFSYLYKYNIIFILENFMYCIYKATNLMNNKIYIGFATSYVRRKSQHKKSAEKSNFAFHRAIRKYGWDNFKWEVIYESWDKEHCSEIMEPFFIKEYNSFGEQGYNMTSGGGGTKELKRNPLTEEQKRHISEKTKEAMDNLPEEIKEKMLTNHKLSMKNPETRKKMSEAKIGKEPWIKGKNQSLEARQKMSEAKKGLTPWNKGESGYLSEESRQKMSNAKKGKPSWNTGVKNWQTEQTFERKRITMEQKKQDGWVNPKKGTKCSEESKKKMRNKGVSIEVLDKNMNRVGVLNGNYDMRENGFVPSCVYKVVSGTYSQYKGYVFRKLLEKHQSYFDPIIE